MENIRRCLLIIIIIYCTSINYVNAQSIADSYSNYAGSRGALLNPSFLTTSNVYADIGLGIGVSANNNYFHLPSKDLIGIIGKDSYQLSYRKTIYGLPRLFSVDFNFGNEKPANANVNVDALVISGMFNFKEKHAFGFFARVRSNINMKNIPNGMVELAAVGYNHRYNIDDGLLGMDTMVYYNQFARNYSNKNTNIGIMAWSELGFSFSKMIYSYGNSRIDFGGNAKLALATGAASFSISQLDYHLELGEDGNINDSLWFMDNAKGEMAYSLPVGYDTPFTIDKKMNPNLFGNYINGYGCGIDVGVTYTYKRNSDVERVVYRSCQVKPIDYQYRIGFSILDIGAVHFGKNKAETLNLETANSIVNTKNFDNINTVHEFTSVFSESFGSEIEKKGFWMGLPTALSLQFDYSFNKHFFINAVVIQPVNVFKFHVSRDAQVLVAPRFESRHIDISLPVTLLNYNRVLLGVSARFAFLTIGTQNLLNLIGYGEVYGLDFYVALKFNLNKGRCHTQRDGCWNSDFGSGKRKR